MQDGRGKKEERSGLYRCSRCDEVVWDSSQSREEGNTILKAVSTIKGNVMPVDNRWWQVAEGQFNGSCFWRPANCHNLYCLTE